MFKQAARLCGLFLCPLLAGQALSAPRLMVSLMPDRSGGPHEFSQVASAQSVYCWVEPAVEVKSVRFIFEPAEPVATQTEGIAPFDCLGTAPDGTANPLKLSALSPGLHTIRADVTSPTGTITTVSASFTIKPPPTPTPKPKPTVPPTAPPAIGKVNWHPGNWFYVQSVDKPMDAALNSPNIKGVLVRMSWQRDAVNPSRGGYDFTKFDQWAAKVQAKGKAFAILMMPMDYWGYDCTPIWMHTAEFSGGQAKSGNRCEPKIWQKPVMDQLLLLYKAVATRYQGNSLFEGLISGEISYTGAGAADWSPANFKAQIARIAAEAPLYFTNATFFFENNWAPNTHALMASVAAAGGGFSGPDLMVYGRLGAKPNGISLSPTWGYPCYNRAAFVPPVEPGVTCTTDYYGKVPLTMNGQEGLERSIKAGYTDAEIYAFAFTDPKGLRLTHMFWYDTYQTPGRNFAAMLRYIDSVGGRISNTACPQNLIARGGCR